MREGVAFLESKRGDGAMNELSSKRTVSGRFLKLVAGGVSLLVLAVLAVLAVGFFADSPGSATSTIPAPTSASTGSGALSGGASSFGNTALHSAIAKGDQEMVRILIDGGTDVNESDVFGEPPLHAAIDKGNDGMVTLLLEAGANVDAKNAFGDPALHRAILKGDSEMVRTLVEAGANINITNAFGDSAPERAVQEDNKEILQILLAEGSR